jgi:ElaB/YqjD/DUF883 family membrane-anchored ribosome-binding protein
MDHFPGITPRERYDNDLLNEMRKLNENIERLFDRNAQAVEQPVNKVVTQLQPAQRRGRKKVVNK